MDATSDIRPRRGPQLPELALTDQERTTLERWAKRRTASQALAERCRIVLACASGASNTEVAQRLGVARSTVIKWRSRFLARRLKGLVDEPRPGAPRKLTDEHIERVIVTTLETTPTDATHWSTRSLARALGMNQTAVSRIWRAFGLKPQLIEAFKFSTDPQFIDRSATSSGCISTHPRLPWSCAWMTRPRSRRWTGPRRCCRCCPGWRSDAPTTTAATAPPTCRPPWTWLWARSSPS
jgi:transposase